jgi:hypothetical protein
MMPIQGIIVPQAGWAMRKLARIVLLRVVDEEKENLDQRDVTFYPQPGYE